MKIIIIEGTDNTGKSTLIDEILNKYNCVKIYHCDKPTSDNPFAEQCEKFGNLVNSVIYEYENNSDVDCVIFNRFYQGEYVYGQMYRNGDPENIKQMIRILEKKLVNHINENDLYYIQVYSDSPTLIARMEDGKSLSLGKVEDIRKETLLFLDIAKFSIIKNKHLLKINSNDNFRDKKDIVNEFTSFINE